MNQAPACGPVFHYIYRPLSGRTHPEDGGFTVTLYDNDVLVFTVFAAPCYPVSTNAFLLPESVRLDYFALVDQADAWLKTQPANLRGSDTPAFSSFFGFDGHPPFIVSDMPLLASLPCGDPIGRSARKLYVLFEDFAALLQHTGFTMTLNSFTWDPAGVTPLETLPPEIDGAPVT